MSHLPIASASRRYKYIFLNVSLIVWRVSVASCRARQSEGCVASRTLKFQDGIRATNPQLARSWKNNMSFKIFQNFEETYSDVIGF